MKKLFISIVGTKDWQCKHMSFNSIFDFEEYCKAYNPKKIKKIDDYVDLKDLCNIMSDCFVTFHYAWQE